MSEITIAEILDTFESSDTYPRAAVTAALAQRTAIIPVLVRILEATLADPADHLTDRSPIYALLLLSHFKATESHSVLVDLLSLPDDWPTKLFGDLITEELAIILYNTSGNHFALIEELVRKQQVNPFVRSAAADVLVYAVADGLLDRAAVLAFFASFLTTAQVDDTEAEFLTLLVGRINDLYPADMLPLLRQVFETDHIDPLYLDLETIEETLANNTVESALAHLRTEKANLLPDDIHELLVEWLGFSQGELELIRLEAAVRKNRAAAKKANTAKQKNKRKMVKASRKKNQRK